MVKDQEENTDQRTWKETAETFWSLNEISKVIERFVISFSKCVKYYTRAKGSRKGSNTTPSLPWSDSRGDIQGKIALECGG